MKNKAIIRISVALIAVAAVFTIHHLIYYGPRLSRCSDTEEVLPLPNELISTTLTLDNDAYLAKGREYQYCTSTVKKITNHLVSFQTVHWSNSENYYQSGGLTLERMPKGKKFTPESVIALTQHGLTTSGPGPGYLFILKDMEGNVYKIPAYELDDDVSESFVPNGERVRIEYSRNGQRLGFLSYRFLKEILE